MLRDASWPNLTSLDLRAGHCTYDALAEIGRWFSAPLPSLLSLTLTHTPSIERLLVPLILSPLMRSLRTLDLRHDRLTDDHVTIIEGRAAEFAHLERLDVSSNHLSPGGVKRLQAIVRRVSAEAQTAL